MAESRVRQRAGAGLEEGLRLNRRPHVISPPECGPPSEVCELAGFGPVAVSAVRDLIDTADPFLAAVVTDGQAVAGVPVQAGP